MKVFANFAGEFTWRFAVFHMKNEDKSVKLCKKAYVWKNQLLSVKSWPIIDKSVENLQKLSYGQKQKQAKKNLQILYVIMSSVVKLDLKST